MCVLYVDLWFFPITSQQPEYILFSANMNYDVSFYITLIIFFIRKICYNKRPGLF